MPRGRLHLHCPNLVTPNLGNDGTQMIKYSSMKRRDITVKICRSWEELAKADREFLENLTPAERILLTWQLSQEQWAMKDANEPRLSRHHTRVIRR